MKLHVLDITHNKLRNRASRKMPCMADRDEVELSRVQLKMVVKFKIKNSIMSYREPVRNHIEHIPQLPNRTQNYRDTALDFVLVLEGTRKCGDFNIFSYKKKNSFKSKFYKDALLMSM